MLLALHASLAWGIDEWWARAFLLAHFGLFLLWQPVWRGESNVESRYAFLVVIVGFLLTPSSLARPGADSTGAIRMPGPASATACAILGPATRRHCHHLTPDA